MPSDTLHYTIARSRGRQKIKLEINSALINAINYIYYSPLKIWEDALLNITNKFPIKSDSNKRTSASPKPKLKPPKHLTNKCPEQSANQPAYDFAGHCRSLPFLGIAGRCNRSPGTSDRLPKCEVNSANYRFQHLTISPDHHYRIANREMTE
ncbi:hypothetical protein [Burkholderia latens]|uniref:hypothetical protein n=1 Tax=Burkholderia latens TaxID=488446 RepID=UPI000AA1563F|nr:hypothetical protein [Burkholderia latens]